MKLNKIVELHMIRSINFNLFKGLTNIIISIRAGFGDFFNDFLFIDPALVVYINLSSGEISITIFWKYLRCSKETYCKKTEYLPKFLNDIKQVLLSENWVFFL